MFNHKSIVLFLALLLQFSLINCGDFFEDPNLEIIGGSEVDIAAHPHIVSLRFFGVHFCGGSAYTDRIIISAGHCLSYKDIGMIEFFGKSSYLDHQVLLGWVAEAYVHPNYTDGQYDNDIAIFVLDRPLEFSNNLKTIKLAKSRPPDGADVVVAGWGFMKEKTENSQVLREVSIQVLKNKICERAYKTTFTPRMICAGSGDGGKDSCQNDSGGPMVYEGKLVGLVSFGRGCGRADFPGAYTCIPDMIPWINDVTKYIKQNL